MQHSADRISDTPIIQRVDTSVSPILGMFYAHHPVRVTCDSEAISSLMKLSLATMLGLKINPTKHSANQADGRTKMCIKGEVHTHLTRNDLTFSLQALVVEQLDCDVLTGVPFMKQNNIVLDLPNDRVIIANKHFVPYGPTDAHGKEHSSIRLSNSFLLRAKTSQVLLPGEFVELTSPTPDDELVALEPRYDISNNSWIQPTISTPVGGVIRIPNTSKYPISIKKISI